MPYDGGRSLDARRFLCSAYGGAIAHRAALIGHRRQDALDEVVGEAARFRRRVRERLDVPHQVRGVAAVEPPVQGESAWR